MNFKDTSTLDLSYYDEEFFGCPNQKFNYLIDDKYQYLMM